MKKFVLGVFFILIILTSAFPAATNQLSAYFLDVGQGDCEVIKSKDSCIVVDTGTEPMAAKIVSFLESKGVKSIDLLVLTHPHADHIGSAVEVLSSFDVAEIFMPNVTTNTSIFDRLVQKIKAQAKKAHAPSPGESFSIGDMSLDFLGPFRNDLVNLNNDSIVFKLTFGAVKMLFMGDAEQPEEADILRQRTDLSADVLKVAHHGSNSSTTDAFLIRVKPKYAVIEVGLQNDYGHPSQKTLNRLAKSHGVVVFQTSLNGTIELHTDGQSVSFIPEKE